MSNQHFSHPVIIRNTNIFTDTGFYESDVMISNGRLEKIEGHISSGTNGCTELDAHGAYLLPSFIDMHVHLREPGFGYKETILSGSKAAAAGGFTTVCSMPNLNPAPDTLENLEKQLEIIRKDAIVEVLPYATITKGRKGSELVDYEKLAPLVAGFSDDGSGVQSEDVMKEAMSAIAKTGKILAAHCEVESLLEGGYIHKGDFASRNNHKGINSESEWKEVERDIRLAAETGCRLHICHMSTKESVQLVREAKAKGIEVTCETGPHYLTFSDEDLQEDGRFKMNPPLRSIEDREALRLGVIDGTIDVIATDHAPHSPEEKSKGLIGSAMGVVGLETSFAAVNTTMVKSGLMSFQRLVEVMSSRARVILGKTSLPFLIEGCQADCVLLNPDERFKVNPDNFLSMGKATPYFGMDLYGKILATINNGNLVFRSNL